MPQNRVWWWKLLHPIQWREIKKRNDLIIQRLKESALVVCRDIENDPIFDHLTEVQALKQFEDRLQKAFLGVLEDPDRPAKVHEINETTLRPKLS